MDYFGVDGIIRRFEQLDDDLLSLVPFGSRVEMTIAGGSALMILGLTIETRMTTDIDVMEAALEMEGLLERYDMNQQVTSFRFRLPENWLIRRQKVPFEGMVLDVYTPSNEDLAILKLDAYRELDQNDLKDMVCNGGIDFKLLQSILDNNVEMHVNYDTEDEWEIFLSRFDEIVRFAHSIEGDNETA